MGFRLRFSQQNQSNDKHPIPGCWWTSWDTARSRGSISCSSKTMPEKTWENTQRALVKQRNGRPNGRDEWQQHMGGQQMGFLWFYPEEMVIWKMFKQKWWSRNQRIWFHVEMTLQNRLLSMEMYMFDVQFQALQVRALDSAQSWHLSKERVRLGRVGRTSCPLTSVDEKALEIEGVHELWDNKNFTRERELMMVYESYTTYTINSRVLQVKFLLLSYMMIIRSTDWFDFFFSTGITASSVPRVPVFLVSPSTSLSPYLQA